MLKDKDFSKQIAEEVPEAAAQCRNALVAIQPGPEMEESDPVRRRSKVKVVSTHFMRMGSGVVVRIESIQFVSTYSKGDGYLDSVVVALSGGHVVKDYCPRNAGADHSEAILYLIAGYYEDQEDKKALAKAKPLWKFWK